jgi:hypothetical protein
MHIESFPVFTSLIASLIVSSVQFPILWGCAAFFNYDIVYLEVYHIPTWVGWRTLTSNTKCWDEDLLVLAYIMMLPQMDSNTFKSPVTKFDLQTDPPHTSSNNRRKHKFDWTKWPFG